MLDRLLADTFPYFLEQTNPENGLIADKTKPDSPSSIAVVGFGLSVYIIGVERGLISREEAAKKTLTILRFFYNSKQGRGKFATGYKGFYYHFLHMKTGERTWNSELSTMDTALFITGALSSACYFVEKNKEEKEIRELADALYKRIDWQWALNKKKSITHGWKPESGFMRRHWDKHFSEAHLLYFLALGSPTFPIDPSIYPRWTDSFEWKKFYGIEYTYSGPLFIHQFLHLWLDMKGLKDDYCRRTGIDYFENARRATLIHQEYAKDNPGDFLQYSELSWGLSASDGPGPFSKVINGKKRVFYDYKARGAPLGPDDGTLSPWAVVASLPFAPEIVLPAMRNDTERLNLHDPRIYGLKASFNPTYVQKDKDQLGWVSMWQFGLNEGPVIMMIDNFQTGFLWKLMKSCSYLEKGIRLAGFRKK
ncbi:MAG: hypothetical protein HOP08_20480 [Cyclobacteriaceae bacterium]|nr:hypothetical protein [Cyclobacteriaceae bacterium]